MRERFADAPIGVFDSGVGGLTVLKALGRQLPDESFIYLGDTARLPYGTKSPQTVARYSLQAAEALLQYGIKCLVVACNTASSVGLPGIRRLFESIPVVGVIEPGAEAACVASVSGRIAVIATEGTVRGGAYQEAILRRRPEATVTARPAQLFVALAEEGLCDGPIAEGIARHYLAPLLGRSQPALDGSKAAGTRTAGSWAWESWASESPVAGSSMAGSSLSGSSASGPSALGLAVSGSSVPGSPASGSSVPDTLVLGCTHFPMLADTIRRVVGPELRIVDSAATTAQAVHDTLRAANLLRTRGSAGASGGKAQAVGAGNAIVAGAGYAGVVGVSDVDAGGAGSTTGATRGSGAGRAAPVTRFLATDSVDRFVRIGSRFLDRPIAPAEVELIDL